VLSLPHFIESNSGGVCRSIYLERIRYTRVVGRSKDAVAQWDDYDNKNGHGKAGQERWSSEGLYRL